MNTTEFIESVRLKDKQRVNIPLKLTNQPNAYANETAKKNIRTKAAQASERTRANKHKNAWKFMDWSRERPCKMVHERTNAYFHKIGSETNLVKENPYPFTHSSNIDMIFEHDFLQTKNTRLFYTSLSFKLMRFAFHAEIWIKSSPFDQLSVEFNWNSMYCQVVVKLRF